MASTSTGTIICRVIPIFLAAFVLGLALLYLIPLIALIIILFAICLFWGFILSGFNMTHIDYCIDKICYILNVIVLADMEILIPCVLGLLAAWIYYKSTPLVWTH